MSSLILTLLFTACSSEPQTITTEEITPMTSDTNYTMEEIARHSTKEDCWLLIENKVYDVTSFIPKHPGEEAILKGCGKDATQMFNAPRKSDGKPHSEKARQNLTNFYIGDLK